MAYIEKKFRSKISTIYPFNGDWSESILNKEVFITKFSKYLTM